MELGFRLARQGLKVIYSRSAKSYMVRPVSFDELAAAMPRRSRTSPVAVRRAPSRARRSSATRRVADALEKWPPLEPQLEAKVERSESSSAATPRAGDLEQDELDGAAGALRLDPGGVPGSRCSRGGSRRVRRGARHLHASSLRLSPGGRRSARSRSSSSARRGRARASSPGRSRSTASSGPRPRSDIFYYLLKDGSLERAYETSVARTDGSWLRNQGVDLEAVPRPSRPGPERAAHRDQQRPPLDRPDPRQHARRRSPGGDVPRRALPPHPPRRPPGRALDDQLSPRHGRSRGRRADEGSRPAAASGRPTSATPAEPGRDSSASQRTSAAGTPTGRTRSRTSG